MRFKDIKNYSDVEKLFNDISNDLAQFVINSLHNVNIDLNSNLSALINNLDEDLINIKMLSSTLSLFKMVHPVEKVQDEASILIGPVLLTQKNKISLNYDLYNKFIQRKDSKEYEGLSKEYKFFFNKQIDNWSKNGLHLNKINQDKLKSTESDLGYYKYLFNQNIHNDHRKINVDKYQLKSVPIDYIRMLPKQNKMFNLKADSLIEESAELESTRKKFWYLNNNIGYPENIKALNDIIRLSDQKGKILGFSGFSELDLSNQMAKNPETVDIFLDNLIKNLRSKLEDKLKDIKKNLAPNTKLVNGKFKPWDIDYSLNNYKSKILGSHEYNLSDYFLAEYTIVKILDVVSELFQINLIQIKDAKLWADNVPLFQAEKDNKIKGFLILDIFYRNNKSRDILEMPILSATKTNKGISVIVANLNNKLSLQDVGNLFHELGHSLHTLLGETELGSHAGTQTTRDFSEMPSQLLEHICYIPDILKRISYNLQTNGSLDDELIEKIIKSRKFESEFSDLEQALYAKISLHFFGSGKDKELHNLYKRLYKEILNYVDYDHDDHFYLSFDHLIAYGAKYYCYLWSKNIGFELLKHLEDLDINSFKKYIDIVLSKGGSEDPNELVEEFERQF